MSAASQYPNPQYPNPQYTGRYADIGKIPMPANFRYAEIFRRGRPRHGEPGVLSTYDAFYIRHPPMDPLRRAKLFAPFDALSGFSGRIAAKEVLYKDSGQYRTAAGFVRKVDTLKRRILIGDENIDLDAVTAIFGNPLLEQAFRDETA